MLNGPIPPQVDPRKLADRGVTLKGELPLANMRRVGEQLVKSEGAVAVVLDFGRDQQRQYVIHGVLDTEVEMICQRCLEPAVLPIHSEFDFDMLWEGQSAAALPQGYDALEVGEDPLDLHGLVEEELLLALPIIPAHPEGACQHPEGFEAPEEPADEEKRPNPFSVLAQLKRDPNV
ncbi:MAG TPA: metal-binding protein [Pseudomonas sp.]|nr:metal-binding protein [Pseudomonas sp.]